MNEFKIGDTVKIITTGAMYSTYYRMAKIMGAKYWRNADSYELRVKARDVGEIICLQEHGSPYNGMVALVRLVKDNKIKEILINTTGIKKIYG